ncbi:MAG TPA: hypothetical protein VKY40_05440 [Halanaerobiales bacterium]|nr:hypothetical protein [Halanaerobiales bacterium]
MANKIAPSIQGQLFYGGLLHDIGGVGLPHHVVHYSLYDKMNQAEVQKHPHRQFDPDLIDLLIDNRMILDELNSIRNKK